MAKVTLMDGSCFDSAQLMNHIKKSGREFVIQGQKKCKFHEHTKPQSLDYWLRSNIANNKDTMQATNQVIEQLVSTGIFAIGRFICPDTGRECKGIQYVGE